MGRSSFPRCLHSDARRTPLQIVCGASLVSIQVPTFTASATLRRPPDTQKVSCDQHYVINQTVPPCGKHQIPNSPDSDGSFGLTKSMFSPTRLEICTRRSETTRELWSATVKEVPSGKVSHKPLRSSLNRKGANIWNNVAKRMELCGDG